MDDRQKQILTAAGLLLGGYAVYRMISKNEKPQVAIKEAIVTPVEVVKDAAEEVINTTEKVVSDVVKKSKTGLTYFAKGSQEAKDYMAKVRSTRKPRTKNHKGHSTKKGLSQDQKLVSSEPHEKTYQKNKKE